MFPGKSDAPSSTLHIKLRDLKKFSTPSPNSYNPGTAEKETRKSAASYSFGMKTEPGPGITSKSCPAPNAYAVPPIKDSPAYSLAARAKEQKAALVPGPGSYEVSGDRTDRLVNCLSSALQHQYPQEEEALLLPGQAIQSLHRQSLQTWARSLCS